MFWDSPEAQRIYRARRRHRKCELPNTLTYAQWDFACEWFEDRCAYCGAEVLLTEDHLRPASKGGGRTALNIVPCCFPCNASKHAKRAADWIRWKFPFEADEIIERIGEYLKEIKYGRQRS